MASGLMKHPEDKESIFILQVKNANPKEILIKSIEELQKEIFVFKDEMLKAIPEANKAKGLKTSDEKSKVKKTK